MEYKIKDTLIVINSSNRADKICTHKLFPKGIIDWVVAIPKDQWDSYVEAIEPEHTVAIPSDVPQFLSSQRQWVMEHYGKAYKYIWLMDDDLTFLRRVVKEDEETVVEYGKKIIRPKKKYLLKKCKKKHINKMMHYVRHNLKQCAMVGVSTRLGNNRVTDDYETTNRVTRCYAISTKAFKDVGATFAPFEPFLAQDFHITLCFLNKGYDNKILYIYAQEDVGSNADGGCSAYRNQELQAKVSKWFAENHPEVTTKEKSSKNWKGYEGARVDMVVQWKKAYKKPIEKRASGGLNKIFDKYK